MELGKLKNLRGEIEIHNLEKVGDKEEAKSADLFHKPNIYKLKLVWNNVSAEGERTNNKDENVLDGLQPHPNLKMLEIDGFKGTSFPLWTSQMAVREDLEERWVTFDNMLEIKLSGCKECEEIPMLGHLPHLKSLYLHQLSNVKSLGSSFFGIEENGVYKDKVIVFPALEKLELVGMENLTTWEEVHIPVGEVSSFPHLQYLNVTDCTKMISAPSNFPCLKELEIDNMKSGLVLANICGWKLTSLTKLRIDLVEELVRLPDELIYNNRDLLELEILNCNNLIHLVPYFGLRKTCLRKLRIGNCRSFEELPEDLHILNALEELSVWNCPNLRSIAYSSGGGRGITSLRILDFSSCSSLTIFPVEMLESCTSSLARLWLRGSKSITNLPQVVSTLPKMPGLIGLDVIEVPNFSEVTAEIGSLRGLVGLGIGGLFEWGEYVLFKTCLDNIFPALQHLRELALQGMERWDALPDHLQHLTTLEELHLYEFGIRALPEWLGNLSSLKLLEIYKCERLRCFPSKKAMQV